MVKQKRIIHIFSLIGCLTIVIFHNSPSKAMIIDNEEKLRGTIKKIKDSHKQAQEESTLSNTYLTRHNFKKVEEHAVAIDLSNWELCTCCNRMLLDACVEIKNADLTQNVRDVRIKTQVLNNINEIDADNRINFIRKLSSENIKLKKERDNSRCCSCLWVLKAALKSFFGYK